MTSEKRLARIAGSLYLVVAVLGGFAELVVRASIGEPGHAAGTAEHIRTSATLFRLGFVADLVSAVFFLSTAMALYVLLRHVNTLVAHAMVVLVAVAVAIIAVADPGRGRRRADRARVRSGTRLAQTNRTVRGRGLTAPPSTHLGPSCGGAIVSGCACP